MVRLNMRPHLNGCSEIGFLPTGDLYVHRAVDGGDEMFDFELTDYVVAPDVTRLRATLAPGRSTSDTGLLELLVARFANGREFVDWLNNSGFSTVHRSDQDGASSPEMLDAKITERLRIATEAADAERNAQP